MDLPYPPRSFLQRHWRAVVALFGIALDVSILAVSFLLACGIYLRTYHVENLLQTYGTLFTFFSLVYLVAITMSGVYRTLSYSSFRSQVYRAGRAYLSGTPFILSVVFFFARDLFFRPSFFALFLISFPWAYLLVWFTVRSFSDMPRRLGFGRANTIAIGSDPDFDRLLERVKNHPELGYNVVSVLCTKGPNPKDGVDHVDVRTVERLLTENAIDQIVFSSSYQLNGSFHELEQICRENHIAMRIVSPESDLLFTKAGLRDIAGLPVFIPERERLNILKQIIKRAFDITGSLIALIVLSPIFLAIAAAIKLESPGPVFFKQRRSLGPDDKPFELIKFRSMRDGAHGERKKLYRKNESNGALFKIKDDPRITRLGRFIRKHSLDELPQFINVLKGEMSMVGPRPLFIKDYKQMVNEDHLGGYVGRRSLVKPGMTGLWQVSGRSELGFREMVLLDLYYIENQTLLYDIEILAQTVPTVLFGKGAY